MRGRCKNALSRRDKIQKTTSNTHVERASLFPSTHDIPVNVSSLSCLARFHLIRQLFGPARRLPKNADNLILVCHLQ